MKLLAVFGAGAILFGATIPEVWNTKDFAAWTESDALAIMTTSPWAKERPMPISQRPGVVYVDPTVNTSSPPTAELGNPANSTTGPNMSTAASGGASPANRSGPLSTTRTPSMASAPMGAPPSQPVMKFIWASALPVRLAVLKLRSGASVPTPDQLVNAQKDWPNYVIAVVGLPAPEGGSDPKSLAGAAYLSVHGKPPLVAIDSDYRRIGNSDVYFFRFPKSALPLAGVNGDVEFKLAFGQMKLSQKFQLAGMTYKGQLAL